MYSTEIKNQATDLHKAKSKALADLYAAKEELHRAQIEGWENPDWNLYASLTQKCLDLESALEAAEAEYEAFRDAHRRK